MRTLCKTSNSLNTGSTVSEIRKEANCNSTDTISKYCFFALANLS